MSNSYGKGDDCYFLRTDSPLSGAATATSGPVPASLFDRLGVQLVVDPRIGTVAVAGSDNVVASSKTFTFANFTFTGLVGAVIHISGASHSGNNGDFVVSSVTSAHVVVCTTASGLSNETFDPLTVTVTVTYPLLVGSWLVELSNDWSPAAGDVVYGQLAGVAGHWSDMTADIVPSVAAVVAATAATYDQHGLAEIDYRALRFTFTSTSGHGYPLVLGQLRARS